jgi:hypothetical protein
MPEILTSAPDFDPDPRVKCNDWTYLVVQKGDFQNDDSTHLGTTPAACADNPMTKSFDCVMNLS